MLKNKKQFYNKGLQIKNGKMLSWFCSSRSMIFFRQAVNNLKAFFLYFIFHTNINTFLNYFIKKNHEKPCTCRNRFVQNRLRQKSHIIAYRKKNQFCAESYEPG
jgi:hypothetical protein